MFIYALYLLPVAFIAILATAFFPSSKPEQSKEKGDIENQKKPTSKIEGTTSSQNKTAIDFIREKINFRYISIYIPTELLKELHENRMSEQKFINQCMQNDGISKEVKDLLAKVRVTEKEFRTLFKPLPPPQIGSVEECKKNEGSKNEIVQIQGHSSVKSLKKSINHHAQTSRSLRPFLDSKKLIEQKIHPLNPLNPTASQEDSIKGPHQDLLKSIQGFKAQDLKAHQTDSNNKFSSGISFNADLISTIQARRPSMSPDESMYNDLNSSWHSDDYPASEPNFTPTSPIKDKSYTNEHGENSHSEIFASLPVPFAPACQPNPDTKRSNKSNQAKPSNPPEGQSELQMKLARARARTETEHNNIIFNS
jgi:hypothetical protein